MGGNKLLAVDKNDRHSSASSSETIIDDAPLNVIAITPTMLRQAIKVLQLRRFHVSSAHIQNHLRRSYPVQTDPKALKAEVQDKLQIAVYVGLITQQGRDKYGLPTIRQQATAVEAGISTFWKIYYNDKKTGRDRRIDILPFNLGKKKLTKHGN